MAEKPPNLWKAIDWPQGTRPSCLLDDDECWYARNFLSGGGYSASQDNNVIFNLKIDPSHQSNPWRWRYRIEAVEQFAYELGELLPVAENGVWTLAPMPTSKPRDADGYNDRLDCVLQLLNDKRDDIEVIDAVRRKTEIRSASRSGTNRPTIKEHIETLESTGEANGRVILVDDVITAGATFRACSNVLKRADPGLKVEGAFWAKTYWDP
jgi:hypothetical protein